jgi:O-antigen/teichoic acid export membrane protein
MTRSRPASWSALAVPVTFVLVNLLSYALLLAAAHLLPKSAYGALSSLLGLLLISTIPMLALQTVAARRAAAGTGSAGLVRGTAVVGAAVTLVLVAASPALAAFLHLSGIAGVLLVAASVPGGAVLGTAMGIAQGRRRFGRLAVLIALATGGRSATGLVGLLIGRSTDATLLGVALGLTAAALAVGLVHPGGRPPYGPALRDRTRTGVLAETLAAALAHGTFLLLTSLDVLLARHVLSASEAGVYAVGSVVTRSAVWLPQSVVALMFASLAEQDRHHRTARRASAVVLGIGAVVVAGTAVAGRLVVSVVGGAKYHRLDSAMWLFALLGALLAVLQLSVLAGLAQRTAKRSLLLWATGVLDVAIVLAAGDDMTPTRLVATLTAVTAAAAGVGAWLTVRAPRAAVQPVLPAGHGPAL